jgi:hypothetical protein
MNYFIRVGLALLVGYSLTSSAYTAVLTILPISFGYFYDLGQTETQSTQP